MALVTTVCGAVLGLVNVLLSTPVIRSRRRVHVPLRSGNNPSLQRAMRAHGNFAESAPLALALPAELGGTQTWLLHGVGLSLLIGQAVHAYGASQVEEDHRLRVLALTGPYQDGVTSPAPQRPPLSLPCSTTSSPRCLCC